MKDSMLKPPKTTFFLKKRFFYWYKWQESKRQFKLTPGRKGMKKTKNVKAHKS